MRVHANPHKTGGSDMRCGAVTIAILISVGPALGQIESSEFTSLLPPDDGWTILNEFCGATQWIDDGWLIQDVDFCPEFRPPNGQQFGYTKSLSSWDGVGSFWYEARLLSDGPASEFVGAGPANFSLWSNGTAGYFFMVARDTVKYTRDQLATILFLDIEPDVPHTYRVELYAENQYMVYIDSDIIDEGIPGGPFPAANPNTNMGARSVFAENMVWWDYVRWGSPISIDGSFDFDSDGDVDHEDYYYVQECLTKDGPGMFGGPENDAGPGCRFADFDADADVDLRDIAAFQNAFTGDP